MSTIKADNIATLAGVSTSVSSVVYGSAKVWATWNGQGTVSLINSYNVTSITDVGTGNFRVNYTNSLPTNHCPIVNGGRRPDTDVMSYAIMENTVLTTGCEVLGPKAVGQFITDASFYSFVAFG
jgi:hypothetical protein